MNNREIERKIRSALEHAAAYLPETLSELLTRCDHQEGEQIMEQEKDQEGSAVMGPPCVGCGRCVGDWGRLPGRSPLLSGQFGGGFRNRAGCQPQYRDQNKRQRKKVRTVTAQNEDAVQILDGMDLKGTDLKVAVNALLGSLVKHGYIGELANSILVTVENDDSQRGERLQTEIVEEINRILSAQSIEGRCSVRICPNPPPMRRFRR